MHKTAIVLGATGLTGGILLNLLISDKQYDTIKLFSRRKVSVESNKIQEYIGELDKLSDYENEFTGDVVFCCIGTTAKKTKDKKKYKNIDYGIPVLAAELSKKNNIDNFILISALGANSSSSIFYNKTKGETEDYIRNLNIKNTYILRPSLIKGNRTESRIGEKIGVFISKIIDPLLISEMKKYRSIEAKTIARAMIEIYKHQPKLKLINSDTIQDISDNKDDL